VNDLSVIPLSGRSQTKIVYLCDGQSFRTLQEVIEYRAIFSDAVSVTPFHVVEAPCEAEVALLIQFAGGSYIFAYSEDDFRRQICDNIARGICVIVVEKFDLKAVNAQ
jgi:hypothetical protein